MQTARSNSSRAAPKSMAGKHSLDNSHPTETATGYAAPARNDGNGSQKQVGNQAQAEVELGEEASGGEGLGGCAHASAGNKSADNDRAAENDNEHG